LAPRFGYLSAILLIVSSFVNLSDMFFRMFFDRYLVKFDSNAPQLVAGDYVLVNNGVKTEPARGDTVAFSTPDTVARSTPTLPASKTISRIIGLPTDNIQIIDGVVYINDVPVKRERMPDFVGADPCRPAAASNPPVRVKRWRETLPNNVSYETLQCDSYEGFPDTTWVYRVPPGHFFMLGDNRENSADSRFPEFGFVPLEKLEGRVRFIYFSIEGGQPWQVWRWRSNVRWNRCFTILG
jgi:signal peptidase I